MQISSNKDEVIAAKKSAIRKINNTLESYISDGNNQNLKKVQLISKWLSDFSNYILFEDKFEAAKNIAYKRGDIVKVNFGFNIGSELGGVHYAIILDNSNKHNADTVVVVPLSSYKPGKTLYERDLYIGSEFYALVDGRTSRLHNEAKEKLRELNQTISVLEKHKSDADASELLEHINKQVTDLDKKIKFVNKCNAELSMMKSGSIVKIEQIRTISKMRILDPKNVRDVLYGIHLSDATMDKITDKIKGLFLH